MSIIAHNIEQNGTLKWIVASPHHNFTETMTTRQLLAAQPSQPQSHLQVYHCLYESSTTIRPDENLIPLKLEAMLLDYIDVGHIHAAQEIIETCLSSGYYPSPTIVLVLMDTLLKRTKNKSKQQRKDKVEQHYKSHALLLQTLKIFGPKVLVPLWSKLGVTHTGKKRRRSHRYPRQSHTNMDTIHTAVNTDQDHYDDDEDDNDEFEHGMRLSRFDDLWHLASYVFTQPTNKLSLNTLGCRLALDVLIKLISEDIRSRRDHKNTLSDCLLLSSIPPNAYGQRSNFNRCLDILFSGIKPSTSMFSFSRTLQAQNMEHTMSLLNQLILLSYCGENLLKTDDLVDQTYRRILGLETNILQHIIQSIQFPAFISSICDIYFEDADDSHVAREHLVYRSRRIFSVSKMKNYILKTRPRQTKMTMAAVMVHCLMVMWRWNAYLRTFSYRYDTAAAAAATTTTTNIEFARKRVDEEGISKNDMMQWKHHILDMTRLCRDNGHKELTTEISEIVEMMVLSIDS